MSEATGGSLWEFVGQGALVLFLIMANGFFVAAEFALVKVRVSQLRPLRKTGDWRVPFALKAVQRLDNSLSTTQVGVTIFSLVLGAVMHDFIAQWLAPFVGHNPDAGADFGLSSIAFILAFGTLSFFHISIGELVPKYIAIQQARSAALWVSPPVMICYYVFFPFIWLLNKTATSVLPWLGLRAVQENEHGFSSEELDYLLTQTRHTHPGDALINKIMVRSLRLRDTRASQVMLPRDQITGLFLDKSHIENIRIAQSSGHSRFPVFEGDMNNVRGMLLVKEWLWQMHALGPDSTFAPIIRPILTFTGDTKLPTLLELFRSSRSHLAVVLGKEGDTIGLLTIEDVLEEIVGEIRDELDIEKGPIYDHTENSILVDATLTMRELGAETGWSFDYTSGEKLTAWVTRNLERQPRKEESIHIGEYIIQVVDMHVHGPRRIRVSRLSPNEIEALELARDSGEESEVTSRPSDAQRARPVSGTFNVRED